MAKYNDGVARGALQPIVTGGLKSRQPAIKQQHLQLQIL